MRTSLFLLASAAMQPAMAGKEKTSFKNGSRWGGLIEGKMLNLLLTNAPQTARILQHYTSSEKIDVYQPDGVCRETRACIADGVWRMTRLAESFHFLESHEQLLLVVAGSLDDISIPTLAPIFARFEKFEDARILIESVWWLLGWDETHGAVSELGRDGKLYRSMMRTGHFEPKLLAGLANCELCWINKSQPSMMDPRK